MSQMFKSVEMKKDREYLSTAGNQGFNKENELSN